MRRGYPAAAQQCAVATRRCSARASGPVRGARGVARGAATASAEQEFRQGLRGEGERDRRCGHADDQNGRGTARFCGSAACPPSPYRVRDDDQHRTDQSGNVAAQEHRLPRVDEPVPAEYQHSGLEDRRTSPGLRTAPRNEQHRHAHDRSRDSKPGRGRRGAVDQPVGPALSAQPRCGLPRPPCGGEHLLGVVDGPRREQPPAGHTVIRHAQILADAVGSHHRRLLTRPQIAAISAFVRLLLGL